MYPPPKPPSVSMLSCRRPKSRTITMATRVTLEQGFIYPLSTDIQYAETNNLVTYIIPTFEYLATVEVLVSYIKLLGQLCLVRRLQGPGVANGEIYAHIEFFPPANRAVPPGVVFVPALRQTVRRGYILYK